MIRAVFLDSGPLGLLTQRHGVPAADHCKAWLARPAAAGVRAYIPEIVDYELRRELLRLNNAAAVARLDRFNSNPQVEYLPLSTPALRLAADLWAQVRRQGQPTAAPHALDVVVILAAQALTSGVRSGQFTVATGNVSHLSRFVPADLWTSVVAPSP